MNVFFALMGSNFLLCRVAAVKSLPAPIYSAVYIFLLVLLRLGNTYLEISDFIRCLDSFSKQIWNILVFFDLNQFLTCRFSLRDDCHVKNCKLTVCFLLLLLPDFKGSSDEAWIAKTAVWPNFFLMNVFFALKGSKLLLLVSSFIE